MIWTHRQRKRQGIASIWVLVVLSILTTLIVTTTWQQIAARRVLRERQNRLQADWLARSGIELAAAQLLVEPKERLDGPLQLVPDSQVWIHVVTRPETPDVFHVTCVAHYPENAGPHHVARSAERTFRRVSDKQAVRLEAIAPLAK